MTKFGFESEPGGLIIESDGADMGDAPASCAGPGVVLRKLIGDTTPKVVRLADIYRVKPRRSSLAENVDAADRVSSSTPGATRFE
jgi:hypothetical protein